MSSQRMDCQNQWSRTFDENGVNVAIPGAMLYFDSSGTRDGDQKFEGKYVPLEQQSPDWNGLRNTHGIW